MVMNTEDKPEWPDIIGSGDYKKALSGGAASESHREQADNKSPPTQLREIAEKYWGEAPDVFGVKEKFIELVIRAMQEATEHYENANKTLLELAADDQELIAQLRQQVESLS